MNFLKKLFKKKSQTPERDQEVYEKHFDYKKTGLEHVLGKMDDIVGHAIIPFQIGGAMDMYYFSNGIPGTALVTMELIEPDGSGSRPNVMGTYELLAFTKLRKSSVEEENDPFEKIERRFCGIFTTLGNYSYEAVLQPMETCEVPVQDEASQCLFFDEYKPAGREFYIDGKKHGLLLCVEVHRRELEFAREHGTKALITKLKEKGHYPYSDLDREAVA